MPTTGNIILWGMAVLCIVMQPGTDEKFVGYGMVPRTRSDWAALLLSPLEVLVVSGFLVWSTHMHDASQLGSILTVISGACLLPLSLGSLFLDRQRARVGMLFSLFPFGWLVGWLVIHWLGK